VLELLFDESEINKNDLETKKFMFKSGGGKTKKKGTSLK